MQAEFVNTEFLSQKYTKAIKITKQLKWCWPRKEKLWFHLTELEMGGFDVQINRISSSTILFIKFSQ